MSYYKLDPANYMTAASLAWDAMLLNTDIELELITDLETLNMIEKSKRGGLCFGDNLRQFVGIGYLVVPFGNRSGDIDHISFLESVGS